MADRVVFEFQKNTKERVRAVLREWNGKLLLDLRVCYEDPSGEWKPTAKGLSLRVDQLPELKKAVMALEEALKMEVVQ